MSAQKQYAILVEQGTKVLIGAFSANINELFQAPTIIMKENNNPFSELPEHVKMSIVQSALHALLGQQLAAMSILSKGAVSDKEVFSAGTAILRHHYTQYLKGMREYGRQKIDEQKAEMGQGPGTGHEHHDHVLSGEPAADENKDAEAVHTGDCCGQDGDARP